MRAPLSGGGLHVETADGKIHHLPYTNSRMEIKNLKKWLGQLRLEYGVGAAIVFGSPPGGKSISIHTDLVTSSNGNDRRQSWRQPGKHRRQEVVRNCVPAVMFPLTSRFWTERVLGILGTACRPPYLLPHSIGCPFETCPLAVPVPVPVSESNLHVHCPYLCPRAL